LYSEHKGPPDEANRGEETKGLFVLFRRAGYVVVEVCAWRRHVVGEAPVAATPEHAENVRLAALPVRKGR